MNNAGNFNVTTPTDHEIVVTRVFDAPRDIVWESMIKPELLKRWLFGPPGWSMVTCAQDQKVGGTFRWAWRNTDGTEIAMHGVYREIMPPERLVRTESFDIGCPSQSGEQLATLVLTERGEKTGLKMTLVYPTKAARDATIASGMEHGMASGYNRLDGLLASAISPLGDRP